MHGMRSAAVSIILPPLPLTPTPYKGVISPAGREAVILTTYGEADGEPDDGVAGVVWVIRTRAEWPKPEWWGYTLYGVCHRPEQFDCWLAGSTDYTRTCALKDADPQYQRIAKIVDGVLAGTIADFDRGRHSLQSHRHESLLGQVGRPGDASHHWPAILLQIGTFSMNVLAYLKARAGEVSSVLAASGAFGVGLAYVTGQMTAKQALVGAGAAVVAYVYPESKAAVAQIANSVAAGSVKVLAVLGLAGALTLGACSPTGQLTPQAQNVVNVLCAADKNAPAVVNGVGVLVTIADPATVGAVSAADAADQLAHPAVQAACAAVGAGAPQSVTVTPAPVAATPAS